MTTESVLEKLRIQAGDAAVRGYQRRRIIKLLGCVDLGEQQFATIFSALCYMVRGVQEFNKDRANRKEVSAT